MPKPITASSAPHAAAAQPRRLEAIACATRSCSHVFAAAMAATAFFASGRRSVAVVMACPSAKKPGLYANIHAKQERIAKCSDEHMNKSCSKESASDKDFKKAAKTKKKTPTKASK